jgi:hypothetical protein
VGRNKERMDVASNRKPRLSRNNFFALKFLVGRQKFLKKQYKIDFFAPNQALPVRLARISRNTAGKPSTIVDHK